MAARGVSRGCIAVALLLAGCSDDDTGSESTTTAAPTTTAETTTTAPERPASTTTTAFDPASVEGEVEAAYLKSWDVYAEAVYNLELDEQALAEVYGEASLGTRREELEERISNGRAAHVSLDHDYQIVVVDPAKASVLDSFVNHQVLIDSVTKRPIELDPNETIVVNFQMKRLDGRWKVTRIQKVSE